MADDDELFGLENADATVDQDNAATDRGWGQAMSLAASDAQPMQRIAQPVPGAVPFTVASQVRPAQAMTPAAALLPVARGYQPPAYADPVPNAQPFFIQGSAAPPPKTRYLRDVADQFMKSASEMGADLVASASLAARNLNANPELVKWLEGQKRSLEDTAEGWLAGMSPEGQKAAHASLFRGGETDDNGNRIPTPGEVGYLRYAAQSIAEIIPAPALAVLGAGLAGAAIAATPAAAAAGAVGTGVAATTFGAMQAGGWWRQVVDVVDKSTPEKMMESPVYAEARRSGLGDIDARRHVVQTMAPWAAAQAALGAGAGVGWYSLLARGAFGATNASLLRRAGIGAAEGAALNAAQAGGGEAITQAAEVDVGLRSGYDPTRVAQAAGAGAGAGAVLGAGGGALHRRRTAPPADAPQGELLRLPPPEGISPDQQAALNEILRIAPPATTYGPGFTMGAENPPPRSSPPSSRVAQPPPMVEPTLDTFGDPRERIGEPVAPRGSIVEPVLERTGEPIEAPPIVSEPTQTALPAPRRQIPFMPDRTQGEGFTLPTTGSGEPARPSGGMNRGNLVEALAQVGREPTELRRMKIGELRDAYDRLKTPAEPVRQEFRPSATADAGAQRSEQRPVRQLDTHPVEQAARAAAEPTPAQAEAGNYAKGHVRIAGLDVSIETPRGGIRRGPIDEATGQPAWQATTPYHYGYIRRTASKDGEQLDVQLGDRAKAIFEGKPSDVAREPVYVIDQIDPATAKFDEHKSFLGFHTALDAMRAYDDSFSDGSGPTRRGGVTEMTLEQFKNWLAGGDTTKPLTYKPTVGAQIRAKRAAEKARMTSPRLVRRAEARPARPDPIIREDEGPSVSEGARAEVARQPRLLERDRASAVRVSRETSAGERSPQTTDKLRILGDIEKKLADGTITAAEADREYGRQDRSGGMPRRYPDLASYLRERIEQAENTKAQQTLLARAAKVQTDKTITGARRIAVERSLNAELRRSGGEYANKLREALRELEDPIAKAADDEARKISQADRLARIRARTKQSDVQSNEMIQDADLSRNRALRDPKLNAHLNGILAENRPESVHRYLDAISGDREVARAAPQLVALAKVLRAKLPVDLKVITFDRASVVMGEGFTPSAKAIGVFMYSRSNAYEPTIAINKDISELGSFVETILHESLHATTARYLAAAGKNSRDYKILEAIGRELADSFNDTPFKGGVLMRTTGGASVDPLAASRLRYALTNADELHTALMSNALVQRIAAELQTTPEFRREMTNLGYPVQPSTSVWQVFTGWVRRVLGMSAKTDSLLDHIMRPLQDIIDRGARFNLEKVLPDELRGPATELHDIVQHAMLGFDTIQARRTERWLLSNMRGLGDRARRAALIASTTDGIINFNRKAWNTKDGNLLEHYRKATEAIAYATSEFRLRFADRAQKLITDLRKSPEREKLVNIMNDATLADVRLGANADNTHLRDQAVARKLQGQYDALSPESKRTYNGFRDYYREMYALEREAMLGSMVKTALPDATPAQVAALTEAIKTKRGIQRLIDNPDASDVARAFADSWDRNRALVRGVAKVHSLGFVQGDYFPLRRYGNYVVHYGTKGTDDYGVEMFERRSAADERRAELVREGAEPSQVLDKRQMNFRRMVPATVMDELDAAIRHNNRLTDEQANAVHDTFASILMQQASRSEAARTRLRRQGVKGASTNAEKVMAQDFLALSSRMGHLQHGPDRAEAIYAMRRHVDFMERQESPVHDPITARSVLNELERRIPSGDDATDGLSTFGRRASTFGFVYSLMSPSHTIISAVDTHLFSIPLLGARHGNARAGLVLAKALRDITPKMVAAGARNTLRVVGNELKASDWNLSTMVRDRLIAGGADRRSMIDLFDKLNAAGLIDHSYVREFQRIAKPGSDITKGAWDRFIDLNGAFAHAIDVSTRSAVAKAAYDLELRRTGSHAQAVLYAVEMTRQAQPNYNLGNKSRLSTDQGPFGPFAAPLTQFKQFGFHAYSVMANLLKQLVHGASKAERREAQKAFAGILVTHSLMAGALTLIADPLRYIGGAYDFITGAAKPHDYQADARGWIADMFGKEVGEIVSRGLPHMAGIDLHQRLGINDVLAVPRLNSFDMKGLVEMFATAMTGAAGQDAASIAVGAGKVLQGQPLAGLQDMLPRLPRDIIKAGKLYNYGVTDAQGEPILPASRISVDAVVAQGLGFTPSQVSEFREARRAGMQERDEMRTERGRLLHAFTAADPDDRSSVIARVQRYNRSNPTSPITYAHLMAAMKRMREQVRNPRTFGLQVSRAGIKPVAEAGRFANVQ